MKKKDAELVIHVLDVRELAKGKRELAALPRSPYALYLSTLSAGSVSTIRSKLDKVAVECLGVCEGKQGDGRSAAAVPWHSLRAVHLGIIRAWLAERCAPSTANVALSAVRGVMGACFELQLMSYEDWARCDRVKGIKGERVKGAEAGRQLSRAELVALTEEAARTPYRPRGLRNVAILALLSGGGLRRAEVVRLDVADVRKATGDVLVLGKGNKERIVPLPIPAMAAVLRWVRARAELVDDDCEALVVATRGRAVIHRRLSAPQVRKLMGTLAKRAEVEGFCPHDFRRSYAGNLLDAGADLATVQAMMGHSNPATTSSYDRRGQRVRRKAADGLFFPSL